MKYQEVNSGSSYGYPNHDVPAKDKDANWCMAYAKAAYYDFTIAYPKGVFYMNGGDYEKFRMYALGKQPNGQYKSMLGVDMTTMNTQMVVDWSIRPIVSQYRDKAISRLMKEDYSIVCTPVDSLSKSEMDKYYQELRAKLIMKEMLEQQGSELATHASIQLNAGEPLDMEELEMRAANGEQFNRAMDAEMAIELGFYDNNYKIVRKQWYEDLFDFGVGGYLEWLGTDNKAKFERLNPESVICSYSKDGTFSDCVHAGVVRDVSLVDLALITDDKGNLVFDEKELQEFAASIAGKFGNPATFNMNRSVGFLKPIDKFKCKVLDIYFYTYNEETYTERVDGSGNKVFRMEESGRGDRNNPRYKRKKIKYVYTCKWVVGTDKCYGWGKCYDQKRPVDFKRKAMTRLPIQLVAYNFYEMRAQGMMERLIPYIDDYQLTMLKIQNFKNRAVPSGWWINMDMMENVAKNKGGANLSPKEVLQMFMDSGILVGRSLDDAGNPIPGNVQPIIPIQSTIMTELVALFQELQNTVIAIEKMTGYNDVTSGNPNPKTLVPGYELANQATNDALYPLAWAEESLTQRLAEDVFCRMQQGIRKGGVEGYAPYKGALGANTLQFIKLDENLSLRDYGIELQKRTTEQEKAWIMQMVNADIMNGLLNVSDAILILETHNAKQAMSILAYRVKKAKMDMQQQELSKIQVNNQGQLQQLQLGQQGRLEEIKLENELKAQMKQMELAATVEMNRDKLNNDLQMNINTNQTKLAVSDTTGQAKVQSTAVAGELDKEKQQIANQKQNNNGKED